LWFQTGVTAEWRNLRCEKFRDLCSSPGIIQVIKSKWMIWAGHVARVGGGEVHIWDLVGKDERNKNHLEDEPWVEGPC